MSTTLSSVVASKSANPQHHSTGADDAHRWYDMHHLCVPAMQAQSARVLLPATCD